MAATTADVLKCLRRARERIANPSRWCRGRLALDTEGHPVAPQSDDAVSWCAVGALIREEAALNISHEVYRFLRDAARLGWTTDPTRVNDAYGHRAVLDLYDLAISSVQRTVVA